MSLSDACEVAERLLGELPERVEALQPAAGGDDSRSFRMWMRKRPLLLKVMNAPGTPIGAYFHARLKEAGVPVPDLLAFSGDAGPDGAACGVFEWVEGEPAQFSSHERPPYDEAEFGRLLRAIHDLRHDRGFGRLDDRGRTSHSRWADWLSDAVDWSCARCVKRGLLEEGLADTRHDLMSKHAEAATWRTQHPSCRSWCRLLREAGFSSAQAAYDGGWFAKRLFDRLPESKRPGEMEAVDEMLRPLVEVVVTMEAPPAAAPGEWEPWITAGK